MPRTLTARARGVPIEPTVFYLGTPVALVSTLMPHGRTNLTPISSAWALGSTYVLGRAEFNQGTRNLLRTPEFVINLPDASLASNVERIAAPAGSDPVPDAKQDLYRHEPDKWHLGAFTATASTVVAPARILECPVQIEAGSRRQCPSPDGALAVHAQVIRTHAHRELVIDGGGYFDLDRWRPVYHTFRHYLAQGDRVGVQFQG